ncbi:MAG: hypothetical protein HFJ09_11105 [Lachnospiraceae bacterium]|nr:hypothetical protein [Lachnospiraceae bacterium]
MFERFGEFNSVEELNAAAEGFLKEGDTESLYALAEENGIDREDAEDYISGDTEVFATLSMAVFGRLSVQEKEISKEKNVMERMIKKQILEMVKSICIEQDMATAIMKKGKNVDVIFQAMKKGAEKHKSGNCGVSCGTDRDLCEIIKSYYLGSEKKLNERIEALYK